MDQVDSVVVKILASSLDLPLSLFEPSLKLCGLNETLLAEAIDELEIEFNIDIVDFDLQGLSTFGALVEYIRGKI